MKILQQVQTQSGPEIQQIRLDHLTVDASVQRSLDEAWVAKKLAAEGFRPDAMGVLVVSHRIDGSYHIIDGQHRRAIAIQAGYPHLAAECQVFEGLSIAEEATMFRLLNERKAVSPIDKFLVRVKEGDSDAVAISHIATSTGWRITQAKTDGSLPAVVSLEKIYNGAGIRETGEQRAVLELLLTIIAQAWGHKSDGVRGEILQGLGYVLLRHERSLDIVKVIRELAAYEGGPLGLIGAAKGLQRHRGGRVGDAMADVVVTLHNKGKRSTKLPEWRTA